MHEMSYCQGVLEAVLRRAGDRPVARIGVRIGTVHRIVPEAFEQNFQFAADGTVAEGATTEVVTVPAEGHCMDCRTHFETTESSPACTSCGSLDVVVEGGDVVVLEWLQYREPLDPADPADRSGGGEPEIVPAHTHTHPHTHTDAHVPAQAQSPRHPAER